MKFSDLSKAFARAYWLFRRKFTRLRLSKWRSAGILLTYRCNASCADCYESSSPQKRSSLPLEDAREYLSELKKLGFTGPRLHFGGGEPFYQYEHLIGCLEAAGEQGLLPLGKLETNGFWCKSDELTRQRLTEIQRLGIVQLHVSSDVFHQEFIPMDSVRRAVRIGREVLGEEGVRVGFQSFFENPIDVRALTQEEKVEVFRGALKQHPWRIVGRAARTLSHLVERHPKETFAGDHCARKLLKRRTIHIDPHGNVFSSTCTGITLGNARKQPLSELYRTFKYRDHPLVKTLVERGPLPLLEEAIQCGFDADEEGYATKCHLCFAARAFFWEKRMYPDEVGPEEVYSD
jgi:MoaA/NifB/PqqE/SkfB family radical SAM enzyme